VKQRGAVLAIDEGTTGVTCLVIGHDGRVLSRGYREIAQHYPRPGWVEHDADEIFASTLEAAREALDRGGVAVEAVGITNQRETVVLWDRETGRPVHRAIVWQDRRTAARCAELAPHAERVRERTGLVIDPYFSGTKIEWLLREGGIGNRQPGALAVGTIDSWLIWRLTNGAVHATDHTNASRTMLYDIDRRGWSDEMCELLHVPRELLPEVRAISASTCRSAASRAINRRRSLARVAGRPAAPKTPMAPAPFSC
jgi:glycerol kinase